MPKILIIEDNPVDIETIKKRLKKKNYETLIAKNGEEGIRLAQAEKPDLIFMDMILPGMHGLEATKKLKQIPETKGIPIVALTVKDSSEFIATCFKEGVSAFIKKPYDFNEIFDKAEIILGIQKSESKKILVIDTESVLTTMITISLMRIGYQVITSPNGKTGIIDMDEENPDLVLLDGSNGGNGTCAAFEELNKSEAKTAIPLVLMTDQSSPEEIQEEMNRLGADDYIAKPFNTKELLEITEKILLS